MQWVHTTQDEDKQSTTQRANKMNNSKMMDINIRKHTQNTIRHELSYKQLEAKTNRTSFYAEIVTDITTRNSERNDT